MSAPALVVFDCDGVLVDTERLTVGVEARVLTELGWPHTTEEVVARWMGRSSAFQLAAVTERLGPELCRRFDEMITAELHDAFERELTAVDGVPQLLDHLDRRGVPFCVASSGTHERIHRTLGITGLLDRFAGRIFSASDVEHGKPAPDLFLQAARSLDIEPSDCAVVEDSVYGVQAGVAAGMTVHGFAGGLSPAGDLAAAGAVLFDRMPALAGVLAPA
ncbi:MAG: HAD family hydrolase [Nocardioidaceae bacterium]